MLTIERALWQATCVMLALNLAGLVVAGVLKGWQYAVGAALLMIALGLVVAAGLHLASLLARRLRTTREGADFRIVVADDQLWLYEPWRRGTPVVSVDLTGVRHIHWYVSAFSRQGTVRVTLWDRHSAFTLQGIDVWPDDPDARQLGWFRAPDLLLQPEQHRRFVAHFEPLVRSGQVTSTVDLRTLQPAQGNADSTAPGWVSFQDQLLYSPQLAETERRLRAE